MRLWTSRSLTGRNTPSRLKIDLGQSEYNGFLSYNGYNGFLLFLPVFDMFEDEIGYVWIIIRCVDFGILRESQSGSRAQVAAMLPVCTMYDHLDRYKA